MNASPPLDRVKLSSWSLPANLSDDACRQTPVRQLGKEAQRLGIAAYGAMPEAPHFISRPQPDYLTHFSS